jgi:succinyl-CoA synthetase beta subunit
LRKRVDIPVPRGRVASAPKEARNVAGEIGKPIVVACTRAKHPKI